MKRARTLIELARGRREAAHSARTCVKRRLQPRQSGRLCRGSRNASPSCTSATCPHKLDPLERPDTLTIRPLTEGVFRVLGIFSDWVCGGETAEVQQNLKL